MSQYKKIEYDDDIVIVTDTDTGAVIYRGIEDYEPLNDEDWKWNPEKECYQFSHYEKRCVSV